MHRPHSSRAKEVPKTSEPSLSATSDPRKGQSFCLCHPWSVLLSLTTLLILLGLGWGIHQCRDTVTMSGAYGKTTGGSPYGHRTSRTQKSYPTDIPPFDGFKRCHVTRSTQWFVVTETALSVHQVFTKLLCTADPVNTQATTPHSQDLTSAPSLPHDPHCHPSTPYSVLGDYSTQLSIVPASTSGGFITQASCVPHFGT